MNYIGPEYKTYLTEKEMDPNGKPFFFPSMEEQRKTVKTYFPKMHCLVDKVPLQGMYESEKARQLAIAFEKCDPKLRATCKSDHEITEWIKGKYIVTIENTWTFRQYEYGSKRLTAHTNFNWFLLGSVVRGEKSRKFTVSNIEFQDGFLQLGQ